MISILATLDPTTLLLGGVVLLCVLWWLSTRRPPGLPPGPGPALPLLGHLYLVPNDPRAQLQEWRRQYGDVFSLYMGGRLVVVLTSYSAMQEAFVTFGDAFNDRPRVFLFEEMFRNKGVIGSSGARWKEQRKATTEILRQMGMGKNVLAEKIQKEITHYIRAIKDHQGAPMDVTRVTQVSASNIVCSIVFGKRFEYNDPDFIKYILNMDEYLKYSPGSALLNYMPMLGYLPGDPFKKKLVQVNSDMVFDFILKHIMDHKKRLEQRGEKGEKGEKGEGEGEGEEGTDFIFSYLQQIQEKTKRGVVDTTLDVASLQNVVNDLFLAGTETISAVMRWGFVYLIRHPEVQEKCFKEISDVIGPDRAPTQSDRPLMTYTEATICEVMRKADIIPLVLHCTSRDVTFRSYVIPKDTVIMGDINSALQDSHVWGDPESFRPERFIGPDGKLTHQDVLVPFSTGRRKCVGEVLSRIELFLFLATLIQHFRLLPQEEGQLPSVEGFLDKVTSHCPSKSVLCPDCETFYVN